jgi:hypothetical protein
MPFLQQKGLWAPFFSQGVDVCGVRSFLTPSSIQTYIAARFVRFKAVQMMQLLEK